MSDEELYEAVGEQVALAHEKNQKLDRYQRMAGKTSQVIKSTDAIMAVIKARDDRIIAELEKLLVLMEDDLGGVDREWIQLNQAIKVIRNTK